MMKTLCTMAGAAILLAGTSGFALAQYQSYSYQPGYAQPAYGTAYQPSYGSTYPPPAYGYQQPAYGYPTR